jgi:hypothetical protein
MPDDRSPAGRVEDNIHVMCYALETLLFAIDEVVHAEAADIGFVRGGAQGGNMRAHSLCELLGKGAWDPPT